MFIAAVLFSISACILLIGYFKWTYNYWNRKGIAQIPAKIPFGSVENPLNLTRGFQLKTKDFHDEFKSKGYKHGGFYLMAIPVYMPIDLEYIKHIMATDFQHFVSRGFYYNEKTDPLSAHLVFVGGEKWKKLRSKFTPIFTSGKLKVMFQTFLNCGEQLKEALDRVHLKQGIDVRDLVECFTTDIIGTVVFGLECNSLRNPDEEFRKYGMTFFQPNARRILKIFFGLSIPKLCKFFGMKCFSTKVTTFFQDTINNIIEYRQTNNITRKDFVQLLLDIKNKRTDASDTSDNTPLTSEEIAAQAMLFFLAGYETTATLITFALYEIAKSEPIQQRARDEINSVLKRHDGKLTYNSIMEMKYIEQIISETLRKYPPGPTLNRVCTKEYKVPNSDIILEKGTKVMISVLALHRDPEYYPDPETFDPNRFSEENKATIQPFTYLPFGEGPRNCIGLRFGMLEARTFLTLVLQNYKCTLNKKTPQSVQLAANATTLRTVEKILLDFQKISY